MNRPNKKRRLPSPAAVLTVLLMMALGFGAGWLGAWMADHADLSGCPGTGSCPSASAASCC